MNRKNYAQEIIKQIGGPRVVGDICGVTSQAVSQWKRIPVEHVSAIMGATDYSVCDLLPIIKEQAPTAQK